MPAVSDARESSGQIPEQPDDGSGAGPVDAPDELFALLYEELRRLANRQMSDQAPHHSLQATALVHEAYLRITNNGHPASWSDRDHFLALAARTMRHVLVDHARARRRKKRSASGVQIPMEELVADFERAAFDLEALDEALGRLEALDPVAVRMVELRFFAGMTMRETVNVLGLPLRTAEREWNAIRLWLRKELA